MWQAISYYGVLALQSLVGVVGIRLYEEPRFDIVGSLKNGIEIRRYGPRLAAEVETGEAGDAGRDEAFGLLFAYIAGANRTSALANERVAMTVPVEVRVGERLAMTVPVQVIDPGAVGAMRFYLPAKFTRDTALAPTDARVRLVTSPTETIAVLRYSGSGADGTQRRRELIAGLPGSPWQPVGEPYTLSYDAPFTLPFARRNEAAVRVFTP
ncbi:heme-binding protein [Reyranella sp.]|uniref:SOUL family heme-binding protein n=1 Tax=Reyranella sp. TaxID=1929291 RepID=UPI00273153F3|nr:heme-binding protein [Reyranella sp.]MDP2373396.1 heme-binding protein [Reyranella sp.]